MAKAKVTTIGSKDLQAELDKQKSIKRGYKALAVVAVCAGIYGYRLGHSSGYTRGVKDGYVLASEELMNAWKEHTQTMIDTHGGKR